MRHVERGPGGVTALHLEDGQRLTAGLFVDASGFHSELLGRTLEVSFQSYSHALYCDRAVLGGWPRTTEVIRTVTTCETMDAGWCWQIEHEHFINRGYVYSSAFLSDDEARAELLRKNPRIPPDQARFVKFRSGRYLRAWEENVVSVGNATGFVEPLEATALACIVAQADTLAVSMADSECRPTPTVRDLYHRFTAAQWDEIRDFLALHRRFNTRLSTPFWQHCRRETPFGNAEAIAAFYAENGPSGLPKSVLLTRNATIAWGGWMAILTGLRVPHARPCSPTPAEAKSLAAHRAEMARVAHNGFSVANALHVIRQPDWRWE